MNACSKRLEMARNVWREMESNDSIECRNCHSSHAMKFDAQKPEGAEIMKKGFAKGETYRLADFRGKQAVVLAWFPKAFTGG